MITAGDRPFALRSKEKYPHLLPIQTRWMDNDVYGHVNNVVHYSYFDTVVNRYLIEKGRLDIHQGDIIALVVETHCTYFSPIAFPGCVVAGLRVGRLGRTSATYQIGLFDGRACEASAEGEFTHVFVGRAQRQPTPISGTLRKALEELV